MEVHLLNKTYFMSFSFVPFQRPKPHRIIGQTIMFPIILATCCIYGIYGPPTIWWEAESSGVVVPYEPGGEADGDG